MNDALDKYLCEKYPKIFSERHGNMQETCMCWGLECGDGWFFLIDALCASIQHRVDNPPYVRKRGIRRLWQKVKQGYNLTLWNKIIYPVIHKLPYKTYSKLQRVLMADIVEFEKAPDGYVPQVVFVQVKEKFSGLRIYARGGDDHTQSLIDFAESVSHFVCERCGKMDHTVGRNQHGWITTTCADHCRNPKDFLTNADDNLQKIWSDILTKKENSQQPLA